MFVIIIIIIIITIAVIDFFLGIADHVLATELNQSLCDAAQRNLALNNVLNVDVLVCESSKFARSIMKRRTYVLSKIKDDKKESVE